MGGGSADEEGEVGEKKENKKGEHERRARGEEAGMEGGVVEERWGEGEDGGAVGGGRRR